jgi:hypothetical protein
MAFFDLSVMKRIKEHVSEECVTAVMYGITVILKGEKNNVHK